MVCYHDWIVRDNQITIGKNMKIIILIRKFNEWSRFAEASSMKEAQEIWRSRIKGRGVTAWTEFAFEEEAKKMLENASYKNKTIV